MKEPVIDEAASRDIDGLVQRVLRDAGFREPPVDINTVLDTLRLDREFYDLEDPDLLRKIRHRMLVGARRLSEFVERIRLQALILFDDKRVLLDKGLPEIKHDWASAHEAGHEIIPWHREFCRGDTLLTLDPAWQEQIEAEANYAASGLLFCGDVFAAEARDTRPCWASIDILRGRYRKSLLATARRYIRCGPDWPMVLLVSTAWWDPRPADQTGRVRYLVPSPAFESRFYCPNEEGLHSVVEARTQRRRGGPVGQFQLRLDDRRGESHAFHVECFYNRHYVISLFTYQGRAVDTVSRLAAAIIHT